MQKKITELRVFQLLDFMLKNSTEQDKEYLIIEMSIRKEFTNRIKAINGGQNVWFFDWIKFHKAF